MNLHLSRHAGVLSFGKLVLTGREITVHQPISKSFIFVFPEKAETAGDNLMKNIKLAEELLLKINVEPLST